MQDTVLRAPCLSLAPGAAPRCAEVMIDDHYYYSSTIVSLRLLLVAGVWASLVGSLVLVFALRSGVRCRFPLLPGGSPGYGRGQGRDWEGRVRGPSPCG